MGQPQALLSLAEYLAIEREDNQRYEYHHGELYAMAGGTLSHTRICGNFFANARTGLDGRDCEVLNSELKVQIEPGQRYVYPDATISCPEPIESEVLTGAIVNPTVVVEVLSSGSSDYDRTEKFSLYFRLPSVKEYVLIAQHHPFVSVFRRHKDSMLFAHEVFSGLETELELRSVDLRLPLAGIYANVKFPPEREVTR